MTYIQIKDDRINLENITGYGIEGDKLRIYFPSGETKSYSYFSSIDRDGKLEKIDEEVGLISLDR